MATFINLDIENRINWKFFLLHLLCAFFWLSVISILVFRLDLVFSQTLPINLKWISQAFPLALFAIIFLTMYLFKWYYNLALIFYPLLIIFWFLPKFILAKGKIYLFSNYLNSIVHLFKKFKKNAVSFMLFVSTFFLILVTDITAIRIISIIVFSYFYFRYVIRYVKKAFNPPSLFGTDIEGFIDGIIQAPNSSMMIINSIEGTKVNSNQSEEEAKKRKLERLYLISFFISCFNENLIGFKGKKAFIISWIYQLIGFFIITISYYTFTNYELYQIDNHNFIISISAGIFDFFYYTIKTITFGNIENIIPLSKISKILEIMSFLTLGIFLLIIVVSIIFTLKQDQLIENVKKATDLCVSQNNLIIQYIKDKYQTDLQTIMNESASIGTSLKSIKQIITNLF